MLQPGYVLDGKYEIQREVGRGGMSIVYLALDLRLRKLWAVKEVKATGKDPNGEIYISQFMQEARMMMRLDHPALPRIVDLIDENGKKYVVMDFVEGQNLFEVIKERGAFPEEEVIEWAKQITDALGYLHRQNPPIIYRDMKPGNVMLKPDGNIKIIDFGIAREYKVGNLTDTVALGTRGYIPPEQYSGQTDPRSDIFAIGMTMHHLLTGVDPRTADAYAPVRSWNPNLSEGIELIINKCTAPAPENRYQNCDELLYDLSHPNQITRDYRRKQKSKLRTFVITAVCAALFIGGGAGMQIYASSLDRQNFTQKIERIKNASSLEEMAAQAQEAIRINKDNPEPLQAMVDKFWGGMKFDEAAASQFGELYNRCLFNAAPSTQAQFDLNLSAAELYLFKFESEKAAPGETVQGALNYLSKNNPSISNGTAANYANRNVSNYFYIVLNYYNSYLLGSGQTVNPHDGTKANPEQQKKDYFDTCEEIVNSQTRSNLDEGTEGEQVSLTAEEKMMLFSLITTTFKYIVEHKYSEYAPQIPEIEQLTKKIEDELGDGDELSVSGVQISASSTLYSKIRQDIRTNTNGILETIQKQPASPASSEQTRGSEIDRSLPAGSEEQPLPTEGSSPDENGDTINEPKGATNLLGTFQMMKGEAA